MSGSIESRVGILENGLMRLESAVERIGNMMSKQLEDASRAPRVVPFKEIMATAAVTLTVFYGVLRFIDERVESATRDVRNTVELHERELQRIRPLIYSQRLTETK